MLSDFLFETKTIATAAEFQQCHRPEVTARQVKINELLFLVFAYQLRIFASVFRIAPRLLRVE
jgi:hypothetical protein